MTNTTNVYTDPQKIIDAIVHAVEHDEIAVIQSTLRATGEKVNVLVAWLPCSTGGTDIYPLALLFNQDPFDIINEPEGVTTVINDEHGQDQTLQ